MRLFARTLPLATILALSALAAQASTTVYSSQSAFDAAATGLTTYNFPTPSDSAGTFYSSPYVLGPLTFSANGGFYLYNDGAYGPGQIYLGTGNSTTESISLAGASAVGLTLDTYFGDETLTIDVNGNLVATVDTVYPPTGTPTPTFFGVTSTTPITSIDISSTNNYGTGAYVEEIDNLSAQVASESPVPEPSSIVLLGTGLLGVAGAMRRRLSRS